MGNSGDKEKPAANGASPDEAGTRPAHDVKQRKIVILGYAKVGKTALTQQLTEDRFTPEYYPTVDQTHYKTLRIRGEDYLLTLLDTAGQDDTSLFQPRYTIATDGYVIVYSIDDAYSFDIARVLYERIHEYVVDGVVVLLGNKTDLEKDRQVSYQQAQALAEEWKCPFLECSAKRKENIQRVFTTIMEEILKREDTPATAGDRPAAKPFWKGMFQSG
eukprot:EG_transcript_15872